MAQLAFLVEGKLLKWRLVHRSQLTRAAALRHGLGKHVMAIPSGDIEPYLLVSTRRLSVQAVRASHSNIEQVHVFERALVRHRYHLGQVLHTVLVLAHF